MTRAIEDRQRKKYILYLSAVLVVLLTVGCVFVSLGRINEATRISGYNDLARETDYAVDTFHTITNADTQRLETLANTISNDIGVDATTLSEKLSDFVLGKLMDSVAVLTPDNRVLYANGTSQSVEGQQAFSQEAREGAHLSGLELSAAGSESYVIRNYVPVTLHGETIAMLFGTYRPHALAVTLDAMVYNGRGTLICCEAEDGRVLFSSTDGQLSNYSFLGDYDEVIHEEDNADIIAKISAMDTGTWAFTEKKSDESYYVRYLPVNINDWMLLLSVPQNVMFEDAEQIMLRMRFLVLLLSILFILFLIVLFVIYFRDSSLLRRQLDQIKYMAQIESTLFNAHRETGKTKEALQLLCERTKSEKAFMLLISGETVTNYFCFCRNGEDFGLDLSGMNLHDNMPWYWNSCCLNKGEVSVLTLAGMDQTHPREFSLAEKICRVNMRQIPIMDRNERPIGVLGVVDSTIGDKGDLYLECIRHIFYVSIKNSSTHRQIVEMGTRDFATGLNNRNSYFNFLREFRPEDKTILGALFIDVNGLHEMNNTRGHEAGDAMLKTLGDALLRRFPHDLSFRLGGDEFLVVICDRDEEVIEQGLVLVREDMGRCDYSISAGVEVRQRGEWMDLADMVKEADRKMYLDKAEYYRHHDRRAGAKNPNT